MSAIIEAPEVLKTVDVVVTNPGLAFTVPVPWVFVAVYAKMVQAKAAVLTLGSSAGSGDLIPSFVIEGVSNKWIKYAAGLEFAVFGPQLFVSTAQAWPFSANYPLTLRLVYAS